MDLESLRDGEALVTWADLNLRHGNMNGRLDRLQAFANNVHEWLIANDIKGFRMMARGFVFENPDDAVLFKLSWKGRTGCD